MISKVIFFSKRGEVLIDHDYRYELPSSPENHFIEQLRSSTAFGIQPHFVSSGIHFFNIQRNDVYLVACSKTPILPVMVIELLTKLYHVCKDFCGVVSEHSLKENTLLMYELLDEFMSEGYVQLSSTEKLRPYIQSSPVVVEKEKSPAGEISSRMFGIETKSVAGSASSKPVIQSADNEHRNELYVDIIEKMVAIIAANGMVSRMEVNGSVNIKNFLSGSPLIKIMLNDDLTVSDISHKGYGSNVQLDRCSFHSCVKQEDFTSSRVLTLAPPVGEISAMTYVVSGEMCLNQPFSLRTFVGDANGSRDLQVTLRLTSNYPAGVMAVNVKVKFPVPKSVSSVSSKFSSEEQRSCFNKERQEVMWTLTKMPGRTESAAEFRLINQGSDGLNRQQIDPIVLEFEISGYTSSGIAVLGLKVPGSDKTQQRKHFIRVITVSDSYIFRTY